MDKNGIDQRVPIAVMAATIVLLGGFALSPAYAKIVKFETPFESSLIPACSNEEVVFSGIAGFTFKEITDKDGNLRQTVTMDYFHTQAQGITSGTKYIVHEHDRYITLLEGGTTTFNTVVRGSFIAQGSEVNTYITMHLVTSIDENGDPHTIVDKVDVKCQG